MFPVLWGIDPGAGVWGHTVILCLTFEDLPNYFLQRLRHFTFPRTMYRPPPLSTSVSTLVTFHTGGAGGLIIAILVGMNWDLIMLFICIFPLTNDVEYLLLFCMWVRIGKKKKTLLFKNLF